MDETPAVARPSSADANRATGDPHAEFSGTTDDSRNHFAASRHRAGSTCATGVRPWCDDSTGESGDRANHAAATCGGTTGQARASSSSANHFGSAADARRAVIEHQAETRSATAVPGSRACDFGGRNRRGRGKE